MAQPCESKEEIVELGKQAAVAGQRLATIEQSRVLDKQELDSFMKDIRITTRLLENFVIEGREQLKRGDEKFDILFEAKRQCNVRLDDMEEGMVTKCKNLKTEIAEATRANSNACVVRHQETMEKKLKPLETHVETLMEDKIARDQTHKIIKNLPSIIASLAFIIAFWDKLVKLFEGP